MIHLPDAPLQVIRMTGTIRLPLTTCAAPFRAPILLADKHALAVRCLKAWAIGVRVRRYVWVSLDVPTAPRAFLVHVALGLGTSVSFKGHEARAALDRDEEAEIRDDGEEEEQEVEHEEGYRGASLASLLVEVANCKRVSSALLCGALILRWLLGGTSVVR